MPEQQLHRSEHRNNQAPAQAGETDQPERERTDPGAGDAQQNRDEPAPGSGPGIRSFAMAPMVRSIRATKKVH